MVPIFVVIEATATFADLAAFGVAIWFENISWLEEDLTGVLINLLEPVPHFLVSVGVVVKRIDCVLNLVHVLAIGEPFEKRFQFAGGLLESGVLETNVVMALGRGRSKENVLWQHPWIENVRFSRSFCRGWSMSRGCRATTSSWPGNRHVFGTRLSLSSHGR